MAGSTAPGLAVGDERVRMLAVKRAKRWVSGCGAVELVIPAAWAAAAFVDVDGEVNEEVNGEVESERNDEADEASVGLCCFG